MSEHLKQRCLVAINRAMFYCLKVANGSLTIVHLSNNRIIPVDEIYDVILNLRIMLPNKDEARKLRELTVGERSVMLFHSRADGISEKDKEEYARRASKLDPLIEKLEVLCGQA